jgi:hypothetical protein
MELYLYCQSTWYEQGVLYFKAIMNGVFWDVVPFSLPEMEMFA